MVILYNRVWACILKNVLYCSLFLIRKGKKPKDTAAVISFLKEVATFIITSL